MAERTIAVWVPDVANPFVEVHVGTNPDAWLSGRANASGYITFQADDHLGDSDIRVTADGYQPYLQHVVWLHQPTTQTPPLNHQITLGQNGVPGLVPLAPAAHGVPFRIAERYCVDATGARFVHRGVNLFTGLRDFRDGGPAKIAASVDEALRLQATFVRTFFAGSIAQNGIMQLDPRTCYDVMRPYAEYLNGRGLGLLATVGVDFEDLMPNESDQLANWAAVGDALRGTNSIADCFNEWRKNGIPNNDKARLARFPQLDGVLCSRGSDLSEGDPEHAPPLPVMDLSTYHQRRDYPKSLEDSLNSPLWAWYEAGYPLKPWFFDEGPRMGTDGSGPIYLDPQICEQFGHALAAVVGGAVFHCRAGQRGELMDASTFACARAFMRGLGAA